MRSRNERTVRQKPRGESWPTGAFAYGGLCPRGHTGAADVAGAARAAQRKQTTESRGPHASVACTRPWSPGPAEQQQDKAQRPRCPASSLQLADAAARGLVSPTQGPPRTGAHGGARGFDQLLQLIGRLRAEKPAKATASKFASKILRCVMINFLTTVASITLFSKSSAANTVNTHTPREIIRSTPGQKRKG